MVPASVIPPPVLIVKPDDGVFSEGKELADTESTRSDTALFPAPHWLVVPEESITLTFTTLPKQLVAVVLSKSTFETVIDSR